MPIKIDVKVLKDEIQPMLKGLQRRMGDLRPLMKNIGETVVSSIERTFEQEGRPRRWKGLAKSTIAQRARLGHWPGKILQRHGTLKSMAYRAEARRVLVFPRGEAQAYAAIHHFGGMAGRGRRVKIPARPFLMVQDEDWAEIKRLAEEYLVRGMA